MGGRDARGLGRHLAQWLVARGEVVDDVASTATARVRELSRGGRRKNDVIDAAAAASVAALQGDGNPVVAEGLTTVLALLDERRNNLVTHRTRLINQLHAMMRDLVPGGAPTSLTVTLASAALTRVRPVGPLETARKRLARDIVREVRELDTRLKEITAEIAATVAEHGSHLTDIDGVGPVMAGRLLGRTRQAGRFPTTAAFANYAGVAPVQVASAEHSRHRLPRSGDRQLNLALHIVALTQVRMRSSLGRAYYDKKVADGKSHNEAMRCLKRRLADRAWRVMLTDERQASTVSPEDNRGRLYNPARLAQPRQPALRTSHFPDPPTTTLRPRERQLDKHRGTPGIVTAAGAIGSLVISGRPLVGGFSIDRASNIRGGGVVLSVVISPCKRRWLNRRCSPVWRTRPRREHATVPADRRAPTCRDC